MDNAEYKRKLHRNTSQSEGGRVIRFEGHIAKENEPRDVDGDLISKAESRENMQGADVRILIDPKASPEDVGRMLVKILDWIAIDGFDPPYTKYKPFRENKIPDYY